MARSASDVAEIDEIQKTDYICTSKESERPAPDTLDETLPKSVIVTSQLPVAKWYDYINEPTLADAIMDRLLANASRIELKGESMRRKTKK